MYPENYRYTKEHEWIRVEGETGTVGITHHAQEKLGDVVYVELPEPGKKFAAMESFGTVESVKAVSDLYCPVSGEVAEVNGKLADNPGLVNEAPHEGGWLIKIKLQDKKELEGLLTAKAYQELIRADEGGE